jgi:hypothetical protein
LWVPDDSGLPALLLHGHLHILGHKASLNKFKIIEITLCITSDDNGIKLDLNYKRHHRKYPNTWRLNNTLLKNHWVTEEIREEI